MFTPDRRSLMVGAASLLGAAWAPRLAAAQEVQVVEPEEIYGAVRGEPFAVPAIDLKRINPRFQRQLVSYDSSVPEGTIVIDPAQHFLYLVDGRGGAIRYGVGVGKQGFEWSGKATIQAKREWPDWYPPKEMLARRPDIMSSMSQLQSGLGMHGGPGNPLGARAMYLYQGKKDTLFRIHGTIEPWTIGSSVSSGCIRMINQDVIDLYERVPIGTEVNVMSTGGRGGDAVARDDSGGFDDGAPAYEEPRPAPRRRRRADVQPDYDYDGYGNPMPPEDGGLYGRY